MISVPIYMIGSMAITPMTNTAASAVSNDGARRPPLSNVFLLPGACTWYESAVAVTSAGYTPNDTAILCATRIPSVPSE